MKIKKDFLLFIMTIMIVSTVGCGQTNIDNKNNSSNNEVDTSERTNSKNNTSTDGKITLKDVIKADYTFTDATLEYVDGVTKYNGTFTFKGKDAINVSIIEISPIEPDGHYFYTTAAINREVQPNESIKITGEFEDKITSVMSVDYYVQH